jgi:hypothetical protein
MDISCLTLPDLIVQVGLLILISMFMVPPTSEPLVRATSMSSELHNHVRKVFEQSCLSLGAARMHPMPRMLSGFLPEKNRSVRFPVTDFPCCE